MGQRDRSQAHPCSWGLMETQPPTEHPGERDAARGARHRHTGWTGRSLQLPGCGLSGGSSSPRFPDGCNILPSVPVQETRHGWTRLPARKTAPGPGHLVKARSESWLNNSRASSTVKKDNSDPPASQLAPEQVAHGEPRETAGTARGHKSTSGVPNGTLIYLLPLSELIEFIPLGDSCHGNGFQRKWDLERLQQIPRFVSQGALMLLEQGEFQAQPLGPSPSLGFQPRPSPPARAASSTHRAKQGGLRPPALLGGQEVVWGLGWPPASPERWRMGPLGMGREVGEGQTTPSFSCHPPINRRGEMGAWFNPSQLHGGTPSPAPTFSSAANAAQAHTCPAR